MAALSPLLPKQGSNTFHGDAFEFLRNTVLHAKGYFDLTKAAFRQNQFGGTAGGPIKRDKIFFFADYQGTRTTQGVSTGDISVPTLAERSGTFSDLTGCVSGPYLAGLISQGLGLPVARNLVLDIFFRFVHTWQHGHPEPDQAHPLSA
jgi:hypothetical protein